jgi:ribosomal protein S30
VVEIPSHGSQVRAGKVTYNGTGAFPGHFKKTITVRTNGVTELTRLYIEGVMSETKK